MEAYSFSPAKIKLKNVELSLSIQFALIAALSLECLAGCKASGGPGAEMACSDVKTGRMTCEPYLDRCMTMKLSMSIFPGSSIEIETKNCSSSFVCDPSSDFHSK